jgi:hypothetical protein
MVEHQPSKRRTYLASDAETSTSKRDEATPSNTPSNPEGKDATDALDTDSASRADADLAAVIDAWPGLPQPVREAIGRLAKLTGGNG